MKLAKILVSLMIVVTSIMGLGFKGDLSQMAVGYKVNAAGLWTLTASSQITYGSFGGVSTACGYYVNNNDIRTGDGAVAVYDANYTYMAELIIDGQLRDQLFNLESMSYNTNSLTYMQPISTSYQTVIYRRLKNTSPTVNTITPSQNGAFGTKKVLQSSTNLIREYG